MRPGDLRGNPTTLNFFRDLFDPAETLVSPRPSLHQIRTGRALNLRRARRSPTPFAGRDADALFPLEEAGFLTSAVPLAEAFSKNDANLLFVQLLNMLHPSLGRGGSEPGGM